MKYRVGQILRSAKSGKTFYKVVEIEDGPGTPYYRIATWLKGREQWWDPSVSYPEKEMTVWFEEVDRLTILVLQLK